MTGSGSDLFSIFDKAASKSAAGVTIVTEDGRRDSRSLSDLLEEAERKALGMRARGLEGEARVALFARTSFEFIVGCLATWRFGGVTVPLAAAPRFMAKDAWADQARARIQASGAQALISTSTDGPVGGVHLQSFVLDELDDGGGDIEKPAPTEVALCQFTSGSTAEPRGVVLTHANLAAQFEQLLEVMYARPTGLRVVSWLPLYHDLGFVAHLLTAMAAGGHVTLIPPELFILDPGLWLVEVSSARAHVSSGPAFAYGMAARALERGLSAPVDLSCWEVAACGGEAVNPVPVERFFRAAEPEGFDPGAFCAGYGLAEATCVTTVVRRGEGLTVDRVEREGITRGHALRADSSGRSASRFVSCGSPLPGMSVKIIKDGKECLEREIGEIAVQGPTVMSGYLDNEKATHEVLAGGWLLTGDRGYIADGDLFVTDRIKELVIVRGQNYSPADLERLVEEVDGTHWGSSVAVGVRTADSEAAVIGVETKLSGQETLASLRTAIQKKLWGDAGISAHEIVLLPRHALPRTSSGKLRREVFREMYEEGKLDSVRLLPN